jgi:serine/threonine-protein kinase
MQPKLPETIGRYKILNLIGRGGMGVLYRAQDPTLERDVALKMMLIDFSFDQTARERFEREAKAVARLQHHNVVTIHELGQSDGTPYIVMELLGGRDLEAVMRSGEALPLATKLEIAAQLCDGLAYAHEQGIVHRDIKPGNVRVLDDGNVKILDFGIAKFAQSSMTQSGAIMGTASYMAPEQILGNPVDGRADLFSVGVLLHEMLAGQKPFGGDSPTAVVYQIVHTEAPSIADRVPGLPDELNAIVARALKKDPNERYASASDMASDLRLVKMILDLPLTTAGSVPAAGGGTAPISIADKLHATGSITKLSPTGAPGLTIGAPGLQTRGPQPEVHKDPQSAPPSPRSRTGLIAAAIVGGVLILGGGAYVLMSGADAPAPETTPTPAAQASPTATPAATPAAIAAPGTKASDTVLISSQPAGARILLNGADTGRVTPASISLGGSDSGRVELSLKGFAPASATLGAADLKRGRREFKLEPAAIPVRLTISGPYAFELRQGGQVISTAATSHDLTVQPGGGVTAHSDEYLLNEPVALDFKTPEVQASIRASGVLAVFAAVETCSIVVDGRNVGFPPLPRKPIAAGAHEVILRCPDGKEETRKITVAPGERITVTFRSPEGP